MSEARRFARRTLEDLGAEDAIWPVTQIVSELATNVVLHAGTDFTLTLSVSGDTVRLEVRDNSSASPKLRHYGSDATTGRGVRLISSLSRRWGVELGGQDKVVWCEVPLEEQAAAPLDVDNLHLDGFDLNGVDADSSNHRAGGADQQSDARRSNGSGEPRAHLRASGQWAAA